MTMHDTLRALQALQELDQEIFKLKEELRLLPDERAKRRAQIDRFIAARDDVDRRHLELRTRIKEIEDMTTQQRQRMRKVEGEAASSRGDMALLAAYQHQIRTLKKDISVAEEEGLQLVEESDGNEAELKRLNEQIEAAEKIFGEHSGNVDSEMKAAAAKLAELEAERAKRLTGDVDAESLTLYERLLAAREGVALAELENRICQRCYMEVPSNLYVRVARGTALAQCPSCDRIFYIRRDD
jgi:predicted  nucleic acid-binding Zn-ribbon protein